MSDVKPCNCGGAAVVRYHPELTFNYSVRCERTGGGKHKGQAPANYGQTRVGAILAWNRKQTDRRESMTIARTNPPKEKLALSNSKCRCGLRMPCNECIVGTSGFQRHSDHGDAGRRIVLD